MEELCCYNYFGVMDIFNFNVKVYTSAGGSLFEKIATRL